MGTNIKRYCKRNGGLNMNQEDKKLLLIVLSTMLPYATKVFYEYVDDLDKKTYGYSLTLNTWCIDELISEKAIVKPYLRPMSSMTEEERKEYWDITSVSNHCAAIDWLNKHYFDYRGLIEKGLAIKVTEENNPYKE